MILKIILITISFFLGYICIHFLRRFDIHEKEPISKMAFVTFFGGIISMIIASTFYLIFGGLNGINFRSGTGALLFIGPIEEFSKISTLFILYSVFEDDMNEPMDGIIYLSSVVLGFSLIENLFYSLPSRSGGFIILLRLLISTPMHLIFSSYMGIAFYYYKKSISKFSFLIITYIFASFLHGMYDLMIFNNWILIIFMTFIYFSYRSSLFLLEYASAKSPFRKTLVEFIGNYKKQNIEPGMECLSCGSRNPKLTYKKGKIRIQKCDKCPFYVSDYNSMFHIFRHFGSKFDRLSGHYIHPKTKSNKSKFGTLYESNFISKEKKLCFFDLKQLNIALEKLSKKIIDKFESKSWFKDNLLISKNSVKKSKD